MNFALSDSCCATCLASTAPVYSLLKVRLVMDTSSSSRLKYLARAVSSVRMSRLTTWRNVHLSALSFWGYRADRPEYFSACSSQDSAGNDRPEVKKEGGHLTHDQELTGIVLCYHAFQCLLHGQAHVRWLLSVAVAGLRWCIRSCRMLWGGRRSQQRLHEPSEQD